MGGGLFRFEMIGEQSMMSYVLLPAKTRNEIVWVFRKKIDQGCEGEFIRSGLRMVSSRKRLRVHNNFKSEHFLLKEKTSFG